MLSMVDLPLPLVPSDGYKLVRLESRTIPAQGVYGLGSPPESRVSGPLFDDCRHLLLLLFFPGGVGMNGCCPKWFSFLPTVADRMTVSLMANPDFTV